MRARLDRHWPLLVGGLFLLPACSRAQAPAGGSAPTLTFVESWPEQTVLDLPNIPDAPVVWQEVMDRAGSRIDIASFYFSRPGDGEDSYGPERVTDRLTPVLNAVARAAGDRGAAVRVLADAKFNSTYPEVPAWLDAHDGITTRTFDAQTAFGSSGVLHAKYFLVDDDEFYIGSQNWDWRALGQIHELGVLVRQPALAADLRRVFDLDWSLAAGEDPPQGSDTPGATAPVVTVAGDTVTAHIVASPRDHLPAGIPWDLPQIVEMIDAAGDSVHVQLLSYGVTDRKKRLFDDLDSALRRAAVRGVDVRMIVSNWSTSRYSLPWLQSLAKVPGIEIRVTSIPEHSGGFIPFARVEHAKYLTCDGRALWIGTSNWSRDYFFDSRNVGLIAAGAGAPRDADRFFNLSWRGPYAQTLDPCGQYSPPRRN
ncbi:hypothetical protein CO151_07210 [bacterium CG_4_9_14_3_um_filter_65_15]|nr:MAG: hypothetical protein CO151_07210 [bacterium CG_4_9_14_3_um_filter_65_15]